MSGAPERGAATGSQRPRRKPGENRAGLLVAGTVEFGLHGYAAAQTAAIARRAGVSQPNVYANFSSKQDLFVACVTQLHTDVQNNVVGDVSGAYSGVSAAKPTDEQSLLLFQAIAALGDSSMSLTLQQAITGIRSLLGTQAYERALLTAAERLHELSANKVA